MGILKTFFEKIKNFFKNEEEELFELSLSDLVLYIAEGTSLKAPLELEEEVALVKQMEEGDEKAKSELIERNLRLVVFIAKRFITTGHPMDDLISIGSIGLIKAVNSYKLDKQIKLATYASRCIENEILMYLRKTSKEKREVSIDEPIKKDSDGTDLSLSDVIPAEDVDVYKGATIEAEKQILLSAVGTLNKREQEIISLRFGLSGGEEKTQKEVADFLDISQSYISRLEKKILERLKLNLTSNIKN